MVIEIDKDILPYEVNMELDKLYTFGFNYNSTYDFFTVDLSLGEEVIVQGEKIVYGRALFQQVQHLDIPDVTIIPFEITDKESRITYENMGDKVFLFLGDVNG